MNKIKCPTCEQDMPEDSEYVSMIDYFVSVAVRDMVCRYMDKKLGIGVMNVHDLLLEHLKDERDTPENIKVWFEKNIR